MEKGILTVAREFMVEFMREGGPEGGGGRGAGQGERGGLEEAKGFEDKAPQQQAVVKSLLEHGSQGGAPRTRPSWRRRPRRPGGAGGLPQGDAADGGHRRHGGQGGPAGAAGSPGVGEEGRQGHGQAGEAPQRAEDAGRALPWQAQGENAAAQATAKDLAEALYGIVAKHAEPEDVLYAMLITHRKDGSKTFQAALAGFARCGSARKRRWQWRSVGWPPGQSWGP